jgi:hypothetical protein
MVRHNIQWINDLGEGNYYSGTTQLRSTHFGTVSLVSVNEMSTVVGQMC